jgi:HAD superfamily hydrolase (TIGR01509 family)
MGGPAAVIFDLDGVLIDSETVWNDARRELVRESGGRWRDDAQRAMMGMSSVEWSRYMREELAVPMSAEAISEEVVKRLEGLYRKRLPLLPGAREAVRSLASRWPLAIASSANRSIIALALELASLSDCFRVSVSSEEVAHGKPAPDVYLEAARRISREPAGCAAVEDSANGLRAAAAAGMRVIAIPSRAFPPGEQALSNADVVLESIEGLSPELVASLAPRLRTPDAESGQNTPS